MKATYIDTSCLVAIAFDEPGSKLLQRRLARKTDLFSHHLIEAEVLSAARREGIASERFSSLLASVQLIFPDNSLVPALGEVFSVGYSRGADALHLATALWLAKDNIKQISFLTLDRNQAKIAKALGFASG